MDDLDDLEHRLDALETWRETDTTVRKALATAARARSSARHTSWQLVLAVVSSATMLVNLYLTLRSNK